ncbi:MAG: hypothetical protein F6J93_16990 [Oscillatoria sp. SIO1A7]|nr:hypothetical protein [Oscillatoria sp. SIO1A7]
MKLHAVRRSGDRLVVVPGSLGLCPLAGYAYDSAIARTADLLHLGFDSAIARTVAERWIRFLFVASS